MSDAEKKRKEKPSLSFNAPVELPYTFFVAPEGIEKTLAQQVQFSVLADFSAERYQFFEVPKLPRLLVEALELQQKANKDIKALMSSYDATNLQLKSVLDQYQAYNRSLEAAMRCWSECEELIPLQIQTVKNPFDDWSQQYTQLYTRILHEVKRERKTVEQIFEQYKICQKVKEADRVVCELDIVVMECDRLHKRLCFIERMTSQETVSSEEWALETIAQLRQEHSIVDDALEMIKEIPLTELDGSTPFVVRTWKRLRLLSEKLKRIDKELVRIFDILLQS